ncbi:hypothetical protein U1Q18_018711 [Sarracenia purpurea var. burkii]
MGRDGLIEEVSGEVEVGKSGELAKGRRYFAGEVEREFVGSPMEFLKVRRMAGSEEEEVRTKRVKVRDRKRENAVVGAIGGHRESLGVRCVGFEREGESWRKESHDQCAKPLSILSL